MDQQTTENTGEYEIDLKNVFSDLWRGFVKFWWIGVLLALLLGGLQFYRRYVRYVPMYQTSATFTVHTQTTNRNTESGVDSYSFYYNKNTADQLQKVFPFIVGNEILQDQVCNDLHLPAMPAQVSASVLPGSNMITLTTRGQDPQLTYDVLLSVVDNYSSVAEYIIGRTKLVMITPPQVPTTPYNSLVWRQAVLKGIAVGLLLGFIWIALYAIMRRTIRTKEEIHSELGLTCLGVLPQVVFKKYRQKIDRDILLTNPRIGNDFLEAVRLLRSTVSATIGKGRKIIMVTSTLPGEGKTVTVLNLAAMYAKNMQRVLVVDCDLHNSGISHMLRDKPHSLVQASDGTAEIHHMDELGFDLMSFNEHSRGRQRILRSAFLKEVPKHIRDEYDLILMDTPPCGIISDAAALSSIADGVVFVIRQDTVVQSSIRSSLNLLRSNGAHILGCILTGASGGLGGYGGKYSYGSYRYSYSHHYGYGYSKKYGYDERP